MNIGRHGPLADLARLNPLLRRLTGREPLPRGTTARALFFLAARRYTPLIAAEQNGSRFIVRTADQWMGRLMFVHGVEDSDVLATALAIIDEAAPAGAARGDVLLDVGANIGTTTVAALRDGRFARTVSIEAHPETADLLRQNVIINGFADHVRVVNAAVSDAVGEVHLAISDVDSGDNRVSTGGGETADRETIAVPATTLDTLVADGTIDPSALGLAWFDIQAHEAVALSAASRLLEADVPIILEYWPRVLRDTGRLDTLERILQANYTRFVDLRAPGVTLADARPVSRLPEMRTAYAGDEFTDLLMLKG